MIFIVSLFSALVLANEPPPTAFPIFLKLGFSSILEFDDSPTKVVIGDSQNFQVERLNRSIVLKTVAPYAASNMFVYFANAEPRLFVLTASEEAEPTYYRKFQRPVEMIKETAKAFRSQSKRSVRIISAQFDGKKDYLTIDVEVGADSKELVKPNWSNVRLIHSKSTLVPYKLWAQRQEVQKDSRIRARFIFAKPNVPKNMVGVSLVIPVVGSTTPFALALARGSQ